MTLTVEFLQGEVSMKLNFEQRRIFAFQLLNDRDVTIDLKDQQKKVKRKKK